MQRPFSIDYRERGFHLGGVFLTQETSRMGTTRVTQDEEADARIITVTIILPEIATPPTLDQTKGHYKGGKSQTGPN